MNKYLSNHAIDRRTVTNHIKAAFLTCDNDVSHSLTILPPFWSQFQLSIAIQHLQETVGGIPVARKMRVVLQTYAAYELTIGDPWNEALQICHCTACQKGKYSVYLLKALEAGQLTRSQKK